MGKKKGLSSKIGGLNEVWTSIKRHYNNVYVDPSRQRIINLFLGIYNPMKNLVPIWNILDDAELHIESNQIVTPPDIRTSKYWVPYLNEFENALPKELRKDQFEVVTRNPDSDSDDDVISKFIETQITLFNE